MRQIPKIVRQGVPWKNLHRNIQTNVATLYELYNRMPFQQEAILDDIAESGRYLCSILADAATEGKTVRSVGGGWSLSDVAISKDVMLETRNLNLWFPIVANQLDDSCCRDPQRMFYMQCGNSIAEVYSTLEKMGYTLPTSGASNGQTIAGALSTGTHGSAFKFGSIQDCVVSIHLIVGPDPQKDSILLERTSDPVLSKAVANQLGARRLRNDELFDAALVSFGSMGFVMGYVLNAEPLYHLESWSRIVPYDDQLQELMRTLNVDLIEKIVPQIPVEKSKVWHVEVVLNPHDTKDAFLTVMERWPTSRIESRADPQKRYTPGDDFLNVIGELTETLPVMAEMATSVILKELLEPRGPVVATPYRTFTAPTISGAALSTEIGVPLEYSILAVNELLSCDEIRDFTGLIACRFIKASKALLAFTQFPVTCTIELPGVMNDRTRSFYVAAYKCMFDLQIPVTAHWGQFLPEGDDLLGAYGKNLHRWIAARKQLLTPSTQAVFSHRLVPRDVTPGD